MLHNVLSIGTNVVKIWLSLHLMGCVRFARHCGKMCSCYFFPTEDCSFHINNFNKRVYIVAFCCVTDTIMFLDSIKRLPKALFRR